MDGARERGQAAVEAAITLPLTVFLILGTIQLFMMLQARAMSHYAAARAARAGSLKHGECDAMRHTAVAALLPTLTQTRTPLELADAFDLRKNGKFFAAHDSGHRETMFWLIREEPQVRQNEEEEFDLGSARPSTLVLRLIYFYPLRIPFANWVISAITLGHFRLQDKAGGDPLIPVRKEANWMGSGTVDGMIGAELLQRAARKHYVMPIQVSYSMRMMTPARRQNFRQKECTPFP